MMKRNPARIGARQARVGLAPAIGVVMAGSLMVAPAAGTGSGGPTSAGPAGLASGSGGPTSAGPAGLASGSGGESYQVTLITGDVVHWEVTDGHGSAVVEDDDGDSTFQTIESGDDYYVIPSEVSPLVGQSLDRELFNVADLVEQGYHDAAVDGIPVIVTSGAASTMRAANATPGLTVEQALPSIDGLAGQIAHEDADAFGDALAKAATADRAGFGTASLGGMEKIWLDQKMTVSLEDSVPQTGAPQAWEAGFDGTGTTIAVLDTGIDASHPDVAGKVVASQDFSESGTVVDGHGHGTHVAATAAGSGEASEGLRTGVAPGADLVIGKVIGDSGSGSTSGIIAGMEWAAGLEDVDVINMSLGGGPTDGTDPLSLAVNELTAEHGVLFVTSAGNDGPGRGSVSTPATADAALAVGAVDKDSELAWFSSRGPRPGDDAITPHITAPGVSIVAARANGTSMGSPVDDFYTAADGTSMASPHVAGAAAILAQQHPDWDPETLKAALINSASPHEALTVFEQGGGELDVARAVESSVVATPGTLDLGYFEFPHDEADPVTEALTYTNHGEDTLTLEVEVGMVDEDGNPVAEGMVTIEPSTISLEPGASAEVDITLDRSLGANATYGGSVVATDVDGHRVAGTPVGFTKEAELYDLTVEAIQRNGEPASMDSSMDVLDVHDRTVVGRSGVEFVDGVATLSVPPGTYSVMATITDAGDGEVQSLTMMGDPQLAVTEDAHLVLDAGEAHEITVDTPYEDVTVEGSAFQYSRMDAKGQGWTAAWVGRDWPYYVGVSDPVTVGEFNFGSKFELSAPGVWMDLAYPEFGALPADPSYEVNEETVATVDTAYHSDTPGQSYARAVPARFPWEFSAYAEYRYFEAPLERVELFSANETRFFQAVVGNEPFGQILYEAEAEYEAGEQLQQSWFASPRTPSLDEGNEYIPADYPTTRLGDTLSVNIFEFGDANPGEQVHYGSMDPWGSDTAAFRLYQDGELYAEGPRAFGMVPVDPQSRLRLELDVARDADWWTTSTQTHTAWEFDSATTDTAQALPLLQVDYDIDLDLTNQAPHPRDVRGPFTIGLDVRPPYGVDGSEIEQVKAWLSYDDGQTWIKRPVRPTGEGSFEVVADRRGGGTHASIKVEARDADGNTVEQEVIRAYKLRP